VERNMRLLFQSKSLHALYEDVYAGYYDALIEK